MKAITRRIGRLEARLTPPVDMEAARAAALISERRRLRMEHEGVPFEEPEPLPMTVRTGATDLELSLDATRLARQRLRCQRAEIPSDIHS